VAETLDAYNMLFTTVAVLAAACWLWSIWVVKKNKSWARWAISASFLAGLTVALAMVFIRDESGDVGVPTELSLLYLLPCVAGLAPRARPRHGLVAVDGQRDVHRPPFARVIQLERGHLVHLAEPVPHGVGVHAELFGRHRQVAAGLQPGPQRRHEAGAVLGVVSAQVTDGSALRSPPRLRDRTQPAQQDVVPGLVISDRRRSLRSGAVQRQAFVRFLPARRQLRHRRDAADTSGHDGVLGKRPADVVDPGTRRGQAVAAEDRVQGVADQCAAAGSRPAETGGG